MSGPSVALTQPTSMGATALVEGVSATAGFAIMAGLLFATAPHNGEFWYSDAPRHALNGAFVKDLIAAMPRDPEAWAADYYIRYPALTILFYPPLFYVVLAPFYAVFGVSHATALAVEMLHYVLLALGTYALARRWFGPIAAFGVGLAVMASPEAALWGRQVMLDIPALSFAVWAMVALGRYLDTKRGSLLYLAVFLLLCAVYTKINAAFLFPVLALTILASKGWGALRERNIQLAALFAVAGMVPIAVLTVKFGGANLQSVLGAADVPVSRFSLANLVWYAQELPSLTGWPLLLLAIAGAILFAARRDGLLTRTDAVLLGSWFIVSYLFLTMIDLKGTRHALILLPPILVAAGLAASSLLPRRRLGEFTLLVFVVVLGIHTLRDVPVPSVSGYRSAAEWIAAHAGKNAIVLFSGERDGSYIFNLRQADNGQDITTLRSDKLLLSIAVSRELGVEQRSYSEEEIASLLDRDGVSYVVAQDGFWTDLAVMARLETVLRSPHFVEVMQLPIVANVPTSDKRLRIYRNAGEVNPHPGPFDVELPIIGRTLNGKAQRE